jgi:Family of unknown function (DUF6169)
LLNPYDIKVVHSGYEFLTDNQLNYYVYFTAVSQTFGEKNKVFSFGFEPKDIKDYSSIPPDQRVGDTIAKIMESFFNTNENVIVYVPYDKDGKDKLRMRLFSIWFNRYQGKLNCPALSKDSVSLILNEKIYINVTAIFRIEQAQLAHRILFEDLPEIWRSSKE